MGDEEQIHLLLAHRHHAGFDADTIKHDLVIHLRHARDGKAPYTVPGELWIEILSKYHLTDVGPNSVSANNQIILFFGAITQNDVDMIFMRCNGGDCQPKSDARPRGLRGICEDPMKHIAR